jgi:hypothetical protein
MQIEKATPFNQDELDLTKKQIDNMSQKDWDKLPIVTGPKPGREPSSIQLDLSDKSPISPNLRDDLPKLEAEKPQPNKALKITKGILRLLSPTPAYDVANNLIKFLTKKNND